MVKALWNQKTQLHPSFEVLHRCLAEDWFLLTYELRLQQVHSKTLVKAGILTAEDDQKIQTALKDIEAEYSNQPAPDHTAEDIHTWIELELTARAGKAGASIHTGRSRNDQVATLLKLWLLDVAKQNIKSLQSLQDQAAQTAIAWAPFGMPMMTHMQFAAPGSAGALPLAHAVAIERKVAMLQSGLQRWQTYCPLGAGAVAGSSIPLDRWFQATELGFDQPAVSSLDASATRDEFLEWLSIVAQTSLSLTQIATDLQLMSQTRHQWIRWKAGLVTGSSMMPNKVNPDACELLRGTASLTATAFQEALFLIKGLPAGYQRDLQCLKPLLYQTAEKFQLASSLAIAIYQDIELDQDKATSAMAEGNIKATLRMEAQVMAGQSLRAAHHAEAEANSLPSDRFSMHDYQTYGAAHPEEVMKQAKKLIQKVPTH